MKSARVQHQIEVFQQAAGGVRPLPGVRAVLSSTASLAAGCKRCLTSLLWRGRLRRRSGTCWRARRRRLRCRSGCCASGSCAVWLRRRQTCCSRACTFVSRAGGRRRVVGGGRSSSSTGRRRLGLGASRGMRAVRTARTSTSLRAPIATTKWCAVCGSGPRSVRCCDG